MAGKKENDALQKFVTEARKILQNDKRLVTEFKSILKSINSGDLKTSIAKGKKNKSKNRDPTVLPCDKSRVMMKRQGAGKVKELNDSKTKYINASHIEKSSGIAGYIASQSPTKETMKDHWLMIWRLEIKLIVMLTNCVTDNETTCVQYWPGNVNEVMLFDKIEVKLVKEKTRDHYIERTFELLKTNRKKPMQSVTQIQFTHWPKNLTERGMVAFHEFFTTISSYLKTFGTKEQPVLAHCSNGGFRTGVVILLCIMISNYPAITKESMYEIMARMGQCRTNIFSDMKQLQLAYEYLIHYIKNTRRTTTTKKPAPGNENAMLNEEASENSNSDADNSDSDADSSNSDADNSNSDADNSNSDADNSNSDADNSNSDADNSNSDADNSNSDADNSNIDADNSNVDPDNSNRNDD